MQVRDAEKLQARHHAVAISALRAQVERFLGQFQNCRRLTKPKMGPASQVKGSYPLPTGCVARLSSEFLRALRALNGGPVLAFLLEKIGHPIPGARLRNPVSESFGETAHLLVGFRGLCKAGLNGQVLPQTFAPLKPFGLDALKIARLVLR